MTNEWIEKFINAVEEVGIPSYLFSTDINTRFYHDGETSLCFHDKADQQIVNFRQTVNLATKAFEGPITVQTCDVLDIHECVVGCDYEQAKQLAEKLGIELSEDDQKVLLKINSMNRPIIPVTGDYHNSDFHLISKESYEKLSPEEKAIYDEKLKEENKRYDLPKGVAARIL